MGPLTMPNADADPDLTPRCYVHHAANRLSFQLNADYSFCPGDNREVPPPHLAADADRRPAEDERP